MKTFYTRINIDLRFAGEYHVGEMDGIRLTILADNNASKNLRAEWGLSVFIEAEGQKVLFDLGASGLFLQNATSLKLDLLEINFFLRYPMVIGIIPGD